MDNPLLRAATPVSRQIARTAVKPHRYLAAARAACNQNRNKVAQRAL